MFEFNSVHRDWDGDLIGEIIFDNYGYEFVFIAKTNKLINIDYGWKIPNIDKMWNNIEQELIEQNKLIKG
jgi:hypothetical protein